MLLKHRSRLGIVGCVILPACLVFSCSSKEKSPGSPSGAAGSSGTGVGGSSGSAGKPLPMGGNSGTSGAAGSAGTGAGGAAGSTTNAFVPDWQTVATHEACSIQSLANKQEAVAFKWEPCNGVSNCERARTSSGNFLGKTDLFASASRITEFEDKVTIAVIALGKIKGYALFATEDGGVQQVFRTQYPGNGITCGIPHVDAYQGRLQVDISHTVTEKQHWDRFIGTLEGKTLSPSNPDYSNLKLPSGQLVGVPGASDIISKKHQFFVTHGYTTVASMEFEKPETLKLLYHPEISPLGASIVQRHGERIAYTARFAAGTGGVRTTYYISDGDSQGKVYLASTNEYDVGSLRFADSHVAWLQGKYSTNGSQNRSDVEIWSSKVKEGSDQLEPTLVAKLPLFNSVYSVSFAAEGGFGRYVIPVASEEGNSRVQVWDLATKTKKEYQPPTGTKIQAIKGLTKEYLWLTIYDQHGSDPENEYLVRYRLNENK